MRSWMAVATCVALLSQSSLTGSAFAATPDAASGPVLAEPVLAEPVLAQATAQQAAGALNAKPDAGGLTPCLLTCYLGPRVGAEYNEGRGIATMEWISLVFFPARIVGAVQAYQGLTMTEWARDSAIDSRPIPPPKGSSIAPGGAAACFIGFCLGPRPAFERNEGRRLRTKEVLLFVPVVNIVMAVVMALESYNGKTMTQIAQDEGLDG